MALTRPSGDPVDRALRWTAVGLWLERGAQAFWPWSVTSAVLGAVALWGGAVPVWAWLVPVAAGVWGLWRFRRPTAQQVRDRVDAQLPGRPLSVLEDSPAIGDAEMWHHHRARAQAQAGLAKPVAPDLRLARFDPYGVRLIAWGSLAVALIFGPGVHRPPAPRVVANAASWEAWAEPPRYAGAPTLYLNDQDDGTLALLVGTRVTVRLYGDAGSVTQNVAPDTTDPLDLIVTQAGALTIKGPGGRSWDVDVVPDHAPSIAITGPAVLTRGQSKIPFEAFDDYALIRGEARITLDLAEVDRRYGLAVPPQAQDPLVVDLPLGRGRDIQGALTEDLSRHLWANLPVQVQMQVTDAADQTATSAPMAMTLTAKRFFHPVAKAIAEQRRDLMWAGANAPRVARVLRSLVWQGSDILPDATHQAALRAVIAQIEAAPDDQARADIAEALWLLAQELEEGSLESARDRLKRAEERLAEAMRNGASPDEIRMLMEELRAAKDDYMRLLVEEADPGDGTDEPDQQDEARRVTQQEIDRLMDEIQRLMEEGRMDEAQVLMDQLSALLEGLELETGSSGDDPAERGMESLRKSLRDQQTLSDDTFRQLQEQFNGSGDAPDADALQERQRELRRSIEDLRDRLNVMPGEEADAARRALDEAADAMTGAEGALGQENLPGAIADQGQALDALRRGASSLSRAQKAEAAEGGADSDASSDEASERDPLGRQMNESNDGEGSQHGELGTPEGRAKRLQDDLRRRLRDPSRDQAERDYLDRLLTPF